MNDFNDQLNQSGYNGNNNLRRKGLQIEWDNEKLTELIKCANDPIYFAEKYIKIVHVDHGLIPIVLYDFQKDIINASAKNRYVTVNTSRQAGKTTTAVVIILHYILFNSHKTVALLANKGDSAREILHRIQMSFESLPKWLQQGVIEWNKGSVEFENGCKIIAGSTSSSAIRGKSISYLYIDETAFIENWDEFFASVFPTITSGKTTKILFTSTPKGLNHFYYTCEGAKLNSVPNSLLPGSNGYVYIEVPWWMVPGRDEEWKKTTLAGMNFDMQKFSQEFCCEFLGSSGTLISGEALKAIVHKKPIVEDKTNTTFVYENPTPEKTYVAIIDVSRGKGLDYSAFQVIDVSNMPYKQVFSYRNNLITPIDYAEIIYRVTKSYNDALVLVEINDMGEQVSNTLLYDFEIDTLLFTESAGRSGKRISGGSGQSVDKGIRTTKTVKSVGCSMLKLLIEQQQLIIYDENTKTELSTFSRKGTSYEAEPGCHDDLVMGLVLFGWLTTQPFFKEITDINTLMRLREKSEKEMEDDLLPFGFNINSSNEQEMVIVEKTNTETIHWTPVTW